MSGIRMSSCLAFLTNITVIHSTTVQWACSGIIYLFFTMQPPHILLSGGQNCKIQP